jgi:predicted aldo/keto reductase-like oxidoreductase
LPVLCKKEEREVIVMERYLGEAIPKLGFGLMRLPKKDEAIDLEQTKEMVDLFLERGFRYFDTSWGYEGSEAAIKVALVDRYQREKYILATKCPVWVVKTPEKAQHMLDTSLERTGAGYFDFYLLHNLGESRTHVFDDYDMWNFVAQKKKEGIIKHIGFSIHDKADALDKILTAHPEAEFVQLQINYADWENPVVESRKCYETARKHGKPIVIMAPVKGGTIASPPRQVVDIFDAVHPGASPSSWGIRFAASLEGVITVLSGMSDVNQMKDNLSHMVNFQPLTKEEHNAVERARAVLASFDTVPCTACAYCMKGCPKSVAIYGIFEAVNIYKMYGDLAGAKGRYSWNTTGHHWGKASDCVDCGKCEEVCPQHISIREELKQSAMCMEG